MPAPFTYQRVNDGDIDDQDDGPPLVADRSSRDSLKRDDGDASPSDQNIDERAWYRRPSVVWLLPVFLLSSLAMGATAMPRMNVVVSLICRNMLENVGPQSASNRLQDKHSKLVHRHGSSVVPKMDMGSPPANQSTSTVVIGDYNPQCAIEGVESATAMLNLWGNLIAGILGAICMPFWGKLSDRFGRVKPLAAATTVMLASEVIVVLMAAMPDRLSLNWIYLTFILEGFSGSFILVMALASSYAADCTRANDRNVALGWFYGSMFFGMAAGPALGGYLGMIGGKSRPLLILYTALGMRAFGILFLALVPESLKVNYKVYEEPILTQLKSYMRKLSRGTPTERLKRANPLQLMHILSPSNPDLNNTSQRNLIALAMINTLMFGASMGAMNVTMVYSEFRFGWNNKDSGVFISIVNIFRTLATVLVLPLAIHVTRRYFPHFVNSSRSPSYSHAHSHTLSHASNPETTPQTHPLDALDPVLICLALLSDTIGHIGFAISPRGSYFTISGLISSLGAIGLATSEASMTKLVGVSKTGELLGALGLLQALARIISPTIANLVYSWTAQSWPQAVFWGIAVVYGVALCVTTVLRPAKRAELNNGKEEDDGIEEEGVPLTVMKVED